MDIELRGISKRFGSVLANQDINLTIRAGEVLGLLGENGAGKSTLMNVLSGLYRSDSGVILIDGEPVEFNGPGDSISSGIGMVHQHFMLVPVFSVVENVILGVEPTGKADYLDLATARKQVQQINTQYGMQVPTDALIEDIPVGIQQRVEILKVLFRSADVLILDEPTAVLTPLEVEEFFGIVRALRDAGKAIVFITHKLHEILEIADRVSVLRQGRIVGSGIPSNFSEADLAEMMVGRPVSFSVDRTPASPGDSVLQLVDINLIDSVHEQQLENINLNVCGGEVVGIAGVQGNGQTELVEAITGIASVAGGKIQFEDQDITRMSVRQRHQLGIAHIPEDRQKSGMVSSFSVAENMVLDSYYDERVANGVQIDWQRVNRQAAEGCLKYDVRTPNVFLGAGSLSGGNQQKMVVARELERDVKLVVASQPTRGVDVGSIEFIHQQLITCRDQGNAVLIISSELDEIMDLSDRIYVMFEGRITAEFDNKGGSADRNKIGLAMAGVKKTEAA
ncbi:ABC transporter ATP-binding protein [Alphaproteobacteria bacterium]|nr:ABC transporter ATP-binding protein [Alphaproteobacteria bacterium]